MFTDFLYLLRSYGMKTSLNEWNSRNHSNNYKWKDSKLYSNG